MEKLRKTLEEQKERTGLLVAKLREASKVIVDIITENYAEDRADGFEYNGITFIHDGETLNIAVSNSMRLGSIACDNYNGYSELPVDAADVAGGTTMDLAQLRHLEKYIGQLEEKLVKYFENTFKEKD